MRRDNEHCEVIIQDKLVEYQRTHTLEIAPVHTHTLEMAPVHTASCSKLQITRQEIASLAICAQPQILNLKKKHNFAEDCVTSCTMCRDEVLAA